MPIISTIVQLNTTPGLQDIPLALGGAIPQAIYFRANRSDTPDAIDNDARLMVGAASSTYAWSCAISNSDGSDPAVSYHRIATGTGFANTAGDTAGINLDQTLYEIDFAGSGSAGNPGPYTDGWRINILVAPTQPVYIAVDAFYGMTNIAVGVSQLIDLPGIYPESVGFEPKMLFLDTVSNDFDTTLESSLIMYRGFVLGGVDTPINYVHGWSNGDVDGLSSSWNLLSSQYSTGRANVIGKWAWNGKVTNFSATGWDMSTTDAGNANNKRYGYLAIEPPAGFSAYLKHTAGPKENANWVVPTGFTPENGYIVGTGLTRADVPQTASGAMAHGTFHKGDDGLSNCIGVSMRDDQNPTICKNFVASAIPPDKVLSFLEPGGGFRWQIRDVQFIVQGGVAILVQDIVEAPSDDYIWLLFMYSDTGNYIPPPNPDIYSFDRPLERYLLEINHPALSVPIRVVNDNVNFTSLGVVYTAVAFEVVWFSDLEDEPPKASLAVNNVTRDLMDWLESSEGGMGATATISLVRATAPDVIIGQATLAMRNIAADDFRVTADLLFDDLVNMPAVAFRYDNINSPGLF